MIILCFSGIWAIWSLVRGRLKVPFDLISAGVVVFLVWIVFSFLWTPATEYTFRKILVFYSIFPLYFVSYGLFREYGEKLVKRAAKAIGFSTFGVCVLALVQFLAQFIAGKEAVMNFYAERLAGFLWGNSTARAVADNPSWLFDASGVDILRAFAVFPDPHMLSYFLALGVPVLAALGFMEIKSRGRIGFWGLFYWLAAGLGLAVEGLTFSRGGYAGFLLALGTVLALVLWKKIKAASRIDFKKGVIGLVFFAAVAGGLFLSENPLKNRVISMFDVTEGSNQGRLEIWGKAWELFRESPVIGVGLGAYAYVVDPSAGYREPIYAHNLYLEFLAEIGILGLVFWVLMLLAAAGRLVRLFLEHSRLGEPVKDEEQKKALYLALIAYLAWFSGHSFFEMPVYSSVVLPYFTVVLAVGSWLGRRDGEIKRKPGA